MPSRPESLLLLFLLILLLSELFDQQVRARVLKKLADLIHRRVRLEDTLFLLFLLFLLFRILLFRIRWHPKQSIIEHKNKEQN